MWPKSALFLTILLLASCTPEKEIQPSLGKDVVGEFIGTFVFDLQINIGAFNPNINDYLAPKKFSADILRSEYDNEISLTNIHGLNTCVYATVTNENFTIPSQDIGIEEELVGFDILPDIPNKTIVIKGSGQLIENPRTATTPTTWEVNIEYRILYDGLPLWVVSGHSAKSVLSGNNEGTCE